MKEDWVKQLRDKLADHQEPAPADMWAQIEARLPQPGAVHQPAAKPRLVFVWAKYVAVAAVFVGMITCNGYLLWRISNEETVKDCPQMASSTIEPEKQEETPMESRNYALVETHEPASVRHGQRVESLLQPQSQDASAEQQEVAMEPEQVPAQKMEDKHETREEAPFEADKEQEQLLRELDEQITRTNVRQTRGRVGFGLYAQNGFGTISFGLSVNIPISSSFSLTTGLVYTRLRSDFVAVMGGYPMTTEQTLYYLGVPLNAQYQFWGYKGLKVYGVAGAEADYNVKARQEMEGLTQEISRDRWQFSLKGGLGVEYDVIPQLGIYVEPGLKYYFDNGSRVQNFFKDKPTNFNLQVGLRWNLR